MEISTRKQARENGHKTYFTNMPCKNDHVTYRYVQSGTCAGCIKDANSILKPDEFVRHLAVLQLVQIKLRAYDSDIRSLTEAAWALAVMRFPMLRLTDICPRINPSFRTSDTAVYAFYCHVEDVPALREISVNFINTHSIFDKKTPSQVQQEIASNAYNAYVAPFHRIPDGYLK